MVGEKREGVHNTLKVYITSFPHYTARTATIKLEVFFQVRSTRFLYHIVVQKLREKIFNSNEIQNYPHEFYYRQSDDSWFLVDRVITIYRLKNCTY